MPAPLYITVDGLAPVNVTVAAGTVDLNVAVPDLELAAVDDQGSDLEVEANDADLNVDAQAADLNVSEDT